MSHTSTGPKTEPTGRRKSRGQSVVELAIITPLLLLMLVGVTDLGRALSAYMTIGSAAGAGASYGMIEGNADDGATMEQVALDDAGLIWGVAPTAVANNAASNIDPVYGFRWVEMTVTYNFSPILGFGPLADTIPMQRTVRMPVLGSGS